MAMYITFMKKEMLEYFRNKKLFIILVVFTLFGLISPLTAKLTPLILESISTEGITIKAAKPIELDAWVQFFKNIGQMGMLVLALVFSSQMSNELEKGTLINLFSKGLARHSVIIAKFSASLIIWFISYVSAFIVAWFYTGYFFENTISWDILLLALSLPFLFGIFIISMELLGGIITGSNIGALSFVGIIILTMILLSMKSDWIRYLPIYLLNNSLDILKGTSISEFSISILSTVSLTCFLLFLSLIVMNRKQLV